MKTINETAGPTASGNCGGKGLHFTGARDRLILWGVPFVDQGDGKAPRNLHGNELIHLGAIERIVHSCPEFSFS